MELPQILKDERLRKIFGAREIEIIAKQINGLSLTQSEKNRLSRDVRPKFDAIRSFQDKEWLFGVKKNCLNKRIIAETRKIILKNTDRKIDAILLFGSMADRSQTMRSDIDICVVLKEDIGIGDATDYRLKMLSLLPEKVDFHVFNTLPETVKSSISAVNKPLFSSKGFNLGKYPAFHMGSRIEEKIASLKAMIGELRGIAPGSFEEFEKDFVIRAASERYIERMAECMTDICYLVIKQKKLGNPKDDNDAYLIMKNGSLISELTAGKLKEAKGMRNIIAHDYEKINREKVFEAAFLEIIPDSERFIEEMEKAT